MFRVKREYRLRRPLSSARRRLKSVLTVPNLIRLTPGLRIDYRWPEGICRGRDFDASPLASSLLTGKP